MRGNAEDPRALALGAAFRISKPLIDDELWAVIEPVLPGPKPRRFRYPGRKPIDNRRALTGILFVSKTGIGWEDLPQEMGCGSGKLSVSERLSDPDFITFAHCGTSSSQQGSLKNAVVGVLLIVQRGGPGQLPLALSNTRLVCPDKLSSARWWKSNRGNCQEAT
jgi:hypothetical protein